MRARSSTRPTIPIADTRAPWGISSTRHGAPPRPGRHINPVRWTGEPGPNRQGLWNGLEHEGWLHLDALTIDAECDGRVGVDTEHRRRPLVRALRRRTGEGDDAERSCVEATSRFASRSGADVVRVVRNDEQDRAALLASVGHLEAEVERRGVGTDQAGQHPDRGADLVVAVLRRLDHRAVDAHRDVVDEHASVDAAEVDLALVLVEEGVERTDDVANVDPDVEREVVARAGGNAHERHAVLRGNRGDGGLRSVAARHADDAGTVTDRRLCDRRQIVTGLQHDRLDATGAALRDEIAAFGLAAAGAQVDDQHGVVRAGRDSVHLPPKQFGRGLPGPTRPVCAGSFGCARDEGPPRLLARTEEGPDPFQPRRGCHVEVDGPQVPAGIMNAAVPGAPFFPRHVGVGPVRQPTGSDVAGPVVVVQVGGRPRVGEPLGDDEVEIAARVDSPREIVGVGNMPS